MSQFDTLDNRLMELLGEDARQSSEKLAAQLSISPATARRRLGRLLQGKVLRVIAVPDPYQIGMHVIATIGLRVDPDKIDEVARTLGRRPECPSVASTTGRYDILAVEYFHSTDDLADFMQKEIARIPGVRDTEVLICLRVYKGLRRT